jgi:hypothetical protein
MGGMWGKYRLKFIEAKNDLMDPSGRLLLSVSVVNCAQVMLATAQS